MRKKTILLGGSVCFAANGWISFSSDQLTTNQQGRIMGYPEVSLLTSNADEVVLEINFPRMAVKDIVKEGITYQTLFIPGGGRTNNLGLPELPTFGRFIAVPLEAEPQIEVLEYTALALSGYNVYPAQEQPVDEAGIPQPEFIKNEDFYQLNKFYPDRMAFVEEPKIIRGCPVSLFVLFPVQYNPATKELKVCSHMKVRISFVGGTGLFIDPAHRSPYFEPLYQNLLLNYSSLGPPPSKTGRKSDEGCDLLIIAHPDFQAWAESLAQWKNLSGIPTWVKDITEIGSDTSAIMSYVQNAYDTWDPPPSFVLLIGDAEFIPVFYRSIHPYDGYRVGTDLYYSTVDGSDWFPDIYMGRISVDTESQASTVMNKILDYQRNPVSTPTSFYNNVLVAGYFQDDELDGYEDRCYIRTSETVRDFLVSEGYSVERCYTATEGSNPQYFCNGEPLPPSLTWDGDATQINNAINDGVFLVNHRDHGRRNRWREPHYTVAHIDSLANGAKLPVVFSINCWTGHFDNETDDEGLETPYDTIYFCEAFQRKPNGGAVGIFGHTRVSYSRSNDYLCRGLYDAIWTNFDTAYPNEGSTHPIYDPMFRMGAVLNFGRFYMYDKYYADNIDFEMFHYFGDPTMQIWTAFPETLHVIHPDTILLGSSDITVTVTSDGVPVESVLVCLANDEVYERGYTDASGEVSFFSSTTVAGSLHITASKHNYRPYRGVISIKEIPFIYGDANGDGVINSADVVYLINYLFKGGPAPQPLEPGDVNCDGIINSADVVYLINFLFKGGPVPGCP